MICMEQPGLCLRQDVGGPKGPKTSCQGRMLGDPWGPRGAHGAPWGPMGPRGAPWGPVGPRGAPWGPVGPCGAPWGPVGPGGPEHPALAGCSGLWQDVNILPEANILP